MSNERRQLEEIFVREAAEQIDVLEAAGRGLQDSPSPQPLQAAFRAAHTLKASASAMGLRRMRAVLEALEERLGPARSTREAVDANLVEVLGDSVRKLRGMQAGIERRFGSGCAHPSDTGEPRFTRVAELFAGYRFLLDDLAAELGKRIEMRIQGADIALEQSVAEALIAPLTHLLRNAADHGIEPPIERMAKGKSGNGLIWLGSTVNAGRVLIELGDDGRGVVPDRIRTEAVRRGLLTDKEAATCDDARAADLVFLPGLSTASSQSTISGRGMGLDAARAALAAFGATLELHSSPGVETRLTVTLARRRASVRCWVVRANGETLAIPYGAARDVSSFVERASIPANRRDFVLQGDRASPIIPLHYCGATLNVEDVIGVRDVAIDGATGDSGTLARLDDGSIAMLLETSQGLEMHELIEGAFEEKGKANAA